MAIPIKTDREINLMREGGKILAKVLDETCKAAKIGISTYDLDALAEKIIREHGAFPAFKGYRGFPRTLCTGIDEVIVHGIPKENEILKDGDLLTIDCGVIYKGMCTDAARSIGIGNISHQKEKLIATAYQALQSAIDIIKPGIHLNEIGKTIEHIVKNAGFYVIYDLTGHGIGKTLHEEPIILNYWEGNPGPILKPGMTLAIEPIFAIGTSEMKTSSDRWTIITKDHSCAVQVENTILITETGVEILTD